jgi:polyisoprenoid-binding protein YceI
MKRSTLTLVLVALASMTASAAATRTGEATATFSGKGPAGFKLEGKTSELELQDDGTHVVVTVPLARLDTGIELRNQHMREKYLETAKYPHAVLQLARASIKLPEAGQKSAGQGSGKMTIRGRTKEVRFKYAIERRGESYNVSAQVPLNLKDYGIDIPSYLGVTVKPDIETAVNFHFKE